MRGPLPVVDETEDHITKPSMLASIDFDEEMTEEDEEPDDDDDEVDAAIREGLLASAKSARSEEERLLWERVSTIFDEDDG